MIVAAPGHTFDEGKATMGNFNHFLTIQEFIDLVAFLIETKAEGKWLRPLAAAPPNCQYSGKEPHYVTLKPGEIPVTESLKDVAARMLPCWEETIAPAIRAGQRVLSVAHGDSLRALVKHFNGISGAAIVELNIPTGIPLVYELEDDLSPVRRFYLTDQLEGTVHPTTDRS